MLDSNPLIPAPLKSYRNAERPSEKRHYARKNTTLNNTAGDASAAALPIAFKSTTSDRGTGWVTTPTKI
jgi:hypothetical protein